MNFFTQFGTTIPLGHNFQAPDPREYAFTEFTTLEFAQLVDLENDETPAGQLWAKTIETFISTAGVKNIWWGRRVDSPQTIKLIIDWKSFHDRKSFTSSPQCTSLSQQWQSCSMPVQYIGPSLFTLPSYEPYRKQAFALPSAYEYFSNVNPVSVFLTFHFSPTFDFSAIAILDTARPLRSKQTRWEHAWMSWRENQVLKYGGGSGVADGWCVNADQDENGWRPGQGRSFIGVFSFMNLEQAQKFFDKAQEGPPLPSWEMSGLTGLRNLADGDLNMDIEFVRIMDKRPLDPPKKYGNPFGDALLRFKKAPDEMESPWKIQKLS